VASDLNEESETEDTGESCEEDGHDTWALRDLATSGVEDDGCR